MRINKNNLTIAEHCASAPLEGYITNGLQFTKNGTLAINRCYSVAVSALQTVKGETLGCVLPAVVKELRAKALDGDLEVEVKTLPLIKGVTPIIKLPDNPVQFEMTMSANFLLKLAQSLCDFTGPEDAIVRIQFTGPIDPIRMDARNLKTGQKWEALVMPRKPGDDAERFAEPLQVSPPPPTVPLPPPSIEEDEFAKALKIAQGF